MSAKRCRRWPAGGEKRACITGGEHPKSRSAFILANIAQLVEQVIRNDQVIGSSPIVGSIFLNEVMQEMCSYAVEF